MNTSTADNSTEELGQANSCLALGAGLGALGATTVLLAGATCPLCLVLSPVLIGVGTWKRYQIRRKTGKPATADAHSDH